MRIELWMDFICPWCGLGKHRLDTALARTGIDAEIVMRSFQLDPTAPAGETPTVREWLGTKKRVPEAQIVAMTGRIEQMAAAEGLQPYRVLDNRVGNTQLAHELAAWGGRPMWETLLKAYWADARSIFDVEALVEIGGEGAREVLTSRKFAAQVKADAREAAELGAGGVPFFVIDRKLAIGGAQPVEVFEKALREAGTGTGPRS